MYHADPITLARSLLNDVPHAAGTRFSDPTLLNFLGTVQEEITRDVRFPAARISAGTQPNIQEYQLPDTVIEIFSVYVNGQLVVPSDLPTIEGHQIQVYDQGSLGGTNVQTAGSGGPTGTAGTFTPRWNVQPPSAYPVTNNGCWPAPDAQTWSTGMRPRWYRRGGYLGIIPAPNSGPPVVNGIPQNNLVIDCVMLPDDPLNLTDLSWFPRLYKKALAMGIVYYAKFSDDTQSTKESRNEAKQSYMEQVGKLRMWAAGFKGDAPDGPRYTSNRPFYERGGYKNSLGYGSYPD